MNEPEFSAEALFSKADRYEESHKYRQAFGMLRSAALLGHRGSQLNLGNFYAWGRGVRKDLRLAAYWYKRAYRNGHATGAFNLAIDMRNAGNRRSALRWFKKALGAGEGEAALELAKMYLEHARGRSKALGLLNLIATMRPAEISEQAQEKAALLLSELPVPVKYRKGE